MRTSSVVVLLAFAFVVAACPPPETTEDAGTCPIGAEGCPCTEGGACDDGLDCFSDLCVDVSGDRDAGTEEPADAGSSTDSGVEDAGVGGDGDGDPCGGPCDDGDACTTEACDVESDVCVTTALLCADLRADVDRDGVVTLDTESDDTDEDVFSFDRGAIFLPNLDDDEGACPDVGTDPQLAACHDAADSAVNGDDDLLDMAPLVLRAWPDAPDDLAVTLTLDATCAENARLFIHSDNTWVTHPSGDAVPLALLRAGHVDLRLEGKDIVRDVSVWDGACTLTVDYSASTGSYGDIPATSDAVRLQLAPVRFEDALLPAEGCFAAGPVAAEIDALHAELDAVCQASAGSPLVTFAETDRYVGDYLRSTHVVMPGPDGPHRISLFFRSAQYSVSGLREGGRVAFTELRGPDVGGVVQYDPSHPDSMDILNAWGGLLMLPPHTHDDVFYAQGRGVQGSAATFYPDSSVTTLLEAQGLAPVAIDTSAFLLGHPRELFTVVPAPESPRGWALVVADPDAGYDVLQTAQGDGHGNTEMFVGKENSVGGSASVSIDAFLADPFYALHNQEAGLAIADMLDALWTEAGLTEADLIRVPAFFDEQYGSLVSFMPSLAAGMVLDENTYVVPDPHGPLIDGVDIFKTALEAALADTGLSVVYIETWDALHVLQGQLPNGLAVQRATDAWWE